MVNLSELDRIRLINAIAAREGTARVLAKRFGVSVGDLKSFVEENKEALEIAREALDSKEEDDEGEPTPTELGQLWITKKFERLYRMQVVADRLYDLIMSGVDTDAVVLREFRAYQFAVANELGQLLHRGSGDAGTGDSVRYQIENVDMDTMR